MGLLGSVLGGAAAGIAGGLFGGGKSGGRQTMRMEPAKWEKDQKQVWDSFIDELFGVSAVTEAGVPTVGDIGDVKSKVESLVKGNVSGGDLKILTDTIMSSLSPTASSEANVSSMIKAVEDLGLDANVGIGITSPQATNIANLYEEGVIPSVERVAPAEPSFREKLEEDVGFRRDWTQRYGEELQKEEEGLLAAIEKYQGGVAKAEEKYLKPVSIGVGGGQVEFIPGARQRSYGAMERAGGDVLRGATAGYGAGVSTLDKLLQLMPGMAPNVGAREYMQFISPIAMQMQGMRYGIPTQTTSAQYQPSLMGQMGTALQAYPHIMDLFKNVGGGGGGFTTPGASAGFPPIPGY